ncbi:DUF4190 domain-containing protein [Streptomyces sp. NPDC050617]|uniref:DUF4190 domain-containing protein n=1 Tax=Streptomyces sp. NPDC050617 TaxID=3154628 RepID=UPI0034274683
MADEPGKPSGTPGAEGAPADPWGAPGEGQPEARPYGGSGSLPHYAPGPGAGYGYGWQAPLPSGQATASMVLGILGLLFLPLILPVIALCLGVSARRKADRGEAGGRGQAVAGIVLGIIGCALAAIGIIVIVISAATSA